MPALSSFGGLMAFGRGGRSLGRKLVQLTISANTNNYVLNTSKVTGYEAGNIDVELTINTGIVVGSASAGSFSLDVDTSWNSLDTVKIINNGSIHGCGGGSDTAGGTALRAQRAITFTNTSGAVRGAGGGGGTGAGASSLVNLDLSGNPFFCSEALPQCQGSTPGGSGGTGQGSNGAATSGGGGGYCSPCGATCGGTGGAGGAYGSSGSGGGAWLCPPGPQYGPYSGGAAGASTAGKTYINGGAGISGGTIVGTQN